MVITGTENEAIFGESNYSRISATSMSPAAQHSQDWGAVLMTGIVNNVNRAIENKVNEATASGQLVLNKNGVSVNASDKMTHMIVIAAVLYLLLK